ncbi:DUF5107 domain-containing protein [Pelagicoccus enzymogenes]|uniref:DUF5107 domain-containing protein n=1 Tax=Pelagicoccus enzymogenes TaxID=2773457 RepID=UPI00280DA276|nr:DUF5107 domain-containing protein [Pelagicoccus enzymogenes]MDQ8198007.1 DUF5107 domain-containing protein [Pelagicoccus enzymogenes]
MSTFKSVEIWEETVSLPTYGIGKPNRNPMFLEKRVYQGSSGAVYPHPVIEKIFDEKQDKDYQAVYLENEYIKVMLLPELGGRVHSAYDKTNDYNFVYQNDVIKPALVGLTGPWISGGIEFNWPQHHRPSTFDPTDHRLEKHDDGSATVWIGEIERMFRTKALVGFRLYPGKAYLELDVRLYNRTSEPQTFLWWANPAVAVNDDYQSVFPPDVHAVMDHGKRAVSDFPIATGEYYKMDYSPGTDISRYKNIPVPTSYMAYHSDFDFVGCYDHGPQAGMLHVANHHVVPGKKQWTWGNGDFGRVWDRQLTDENGPYIELMCGAYTDNQPDFTWLMPGEEKRFTQIFMPYKGIGPASNADKNGALSLDRNGNSARIGVYLTSKDTVTVTLTAKGDQIWQKKLELDPTSPFVETLAVSEALADQDFTLTVRSAKRKLSFTPLSDEKPDVPAPATPAKAPQDIESNEELFLNGLHLEQYRHATYRPEPYYEEALRRDPGDSRCNNAMGLLLLRAGKPACAETYFRKAVERQTLRNPNPYDGEAYYNLGLALKRQGKRQEAFDALHKSVWNDAWQCAGYFELARLSCLDGNFEQALEQVDRSLSRNIHHHKARHLKIAVLRQLGREQEAKAEIEVALSHDAIEFGALREKLLLTGESEFTSLIRGYVHNYIEIALDYAEAGFFEEAVTLLSEAPQDYPMVNYYAGWIELKRGKQKAASEAFEKASIASPDYCFPNRFESVAALSAAIECDAEDAKAPYYLGNFWYSRRQYGDAISSWERSVELDPNFAIPWRNLGLAYMNKRQHSEAALQGLETAFNLASDDARIFFELDQLRKKTGFSLEERLAAMEAKRELVLERDDQTVELVSLYNIQGRYSDALEILESRNFHPWEGGEGKVAYQFTASLIGLAKQALQEGKFADALAHLEKTRSYPDNLGEGKLHGAQENDVLYFMGCAYEGLGETEKAQACFKTASTGLSEPTSAMYYNDQPPESIYFQGLANEKLGQHEKAQTIFQRLVSYAEEHIHDDVKMDYFAVSLPDFLVFDEDLNEQNRIHCLFISALGYTGLGETEKAAAAFEKLLEAAPFHRGAILQQFLPNASTVTP